MRCIFESKRTKADTILSYSIYFCLIIMSLLESNGHPLGAGNPFIAYPVDDLICKICEFAGFKATLKLISTAKFVHTFDVKAMLCAALVQEDAFSTSSLAQSLMLDRCRGGDKLSTAVLTIGDGTFNTGM